MSESKIVALGVGIGFAILLGMYAIEIGRASADQASEAMDKPFDRNAADEYRAVDAEP